MSHSGLPNATMNKPSNDFANANAQAIGPPATKPNGCSIASRDPTWQLKTRLEQLSDSIDDLEAVLIENDPLDTLEDALGRIRSCIIEIEEML